MHGSRALARTVSGTLPQFGLKFKAKLEGTLTNTLATCGVGISACQVSNFDTLLAEMIAHVLYVF